MPIHVRESADPLSAQTPGSIINAQSDAGRILQLELGRYCAGQISGRSFLIAGHRGAGKTTMVADALARVRWDCLERNLPMRPLPIFLHGPGLLEILPSDLDEAARGDAAERGSVDADSFDLTEQEDEEETGGDDEESDSDKENRTKKGSQNGRSGSVKADIEPAHERQAQLALEQIILGLQRAVVKEFAICYRRKLLTGAAPAMHAELAELAAQFEIEIMEDPPASRLRQFWSDAEALSAGVLFERGRTASQGSHELVALNGVCNAHQRISGELSQRDTRKQSSKRATERSRGFDVKAADALKPLGAVFAGSAVAGGAAAGALVQPYTAAAFGLAAAWLASLFLKGSSTSHNKRERQLDRTFIPDLSLRTLDRVLPMLLDRLRLAGLAPVLIVDELDKVECLSDRIVTIVRYLKKLMAENVFSCFLTDRGYLEHLRIDGRKRAYGQAYSYFSQPLLVTYSPADLHQYLTRLLDVSEGEAGRAADATATQLKEERLDCEVLKWVLRHRSQLHALALSREIAALRNHDNTLQVTGGAVRSLYTYRIDVTLQMAIEVQLHRPDVVGWLQRNSGMRQTLFDALYYVSRRWLEGAEDVATTPAGRKAFAEDLQRRMNLSEAGARKAQNHAEKTRQKPATPEPESRVQKGKRAGDAEQSEPAAEALTKDDMTLLYDVLDGVTGFLAQTNTTEDVAKMWSDIEQRPELGRVKRPEQEVLDALLLGGLSLLVSQGGARRPKKRGASSAAPPRRKERGFVYKWRYWPSGAPRDPKHAELRDSQRLRDAAARQIRAIRAIESALWPLFRRATEPAEPDGAVYRLLAEGCRVLRTTPAWSQVQAAILNLELVAKGQGSLRQIEENCQVIAGFAQVLEDGKGAVQAALMSAAFLRGVSEADSSSASLDLRDSLAVLSSALGFAKLDHEGVRAAVERFETDLARHRGATPLAYELVDLSAPELPQNVTKAFEAGKRLRLDWKPVAASAWEALFKRLLELAQGRGEHSPASPLEILCAVRGIGPYRLLGPLVDRIPLHAWTNVLLAALRPAASATDDANAPPFRAAAFALWRLGAANLSADDSGRLLRTAAEIANVPAPVQRELHSDHEGLGLLRGGQSPRAVIMVKSDESSVTASWTWTPQLCLALVVTNAQLTADEPLRRLLEAAAPPALTYAWEQGPDGSALHEASMENLPTTTAAQAGHVFVYKRGVRAMKRPHIVEPAGPDDLFGHMPASPAS